MSGSDAQLYYEVIRRKGWLASIPEEKRDQILVDLVEQLGEPDLTPRNRASLLRCLAQFDKLDVERAKLAFAVDQGRDPEDLSEPFVYRRLSADDADD